MHRQVTISAAIGKHSDAEGGSDGSNAASSWTKGVHRSGLEMRPEPSPRNHVTVHQLHGHSHSQCPEMCPSGRANGLVSLKKE